MKKRISILILLLVAAFLIVRWRTRGTKSGRESRPQVQLPAPAPIAVSADDATQVVTSTNQVPPPKIGEYTKPSGGSLVVWNYDGEVDFQFIAHYKLTELQVSQLKELRNEAIRRVRQMDSRNAVVRISSDRRFISIEIKPYPEEARSYSDFLMDRLAAVLGNDAYEDLTHSMSLPLGDEVCWAGLTTKKVEIEKLPPSADGIRYRLKYLRELQGIAGPNTVTTEGILSREKVGSICYVAPAVMPSDF